jgi:alpha-mannosidase
MRGGTAYDFDSFWIQCPKVKSWYRRNEHALQAAEILSTIASLQSGFRYPVQSLYHAWLQMFLNMDRNTLWGAAGGMVFEHETSWDARDRFQSAQAIAQETVEAAGQALLPPGEGLGLFNPLNWKRDDPFILHLPEGGGIEGAVCQRMPDGTTLCRMELPAMGIGTWRRGAPAVLSRPSGLPEAIDTKYYQARLDSKTGALASLKLKPSGREMLGGPGNVIVAEKPEEQSSDPGDHMLPRPKRIRLSTSSEFEQTIAVTEGPLAVTVEIESKFFGGGHCSRVARFYHDHPRIDFETELQDIPDRTVVVAEFPLAEDILELRRGIPYGFSHGAWSKPNPELHGWTQGIVPAIRWSHYAMEHGGVALLDRGVTGRELNGRTPIIYLYNATDKYYGYPNPWLSGKGKHLLAYALAAHGGDWKLARIPQMAWEYNCPPIIVPGRAQAAPRSFVETSDNVIVEAMHREGSDVELRLVESLGAEGTAEVRLALPHEKAALTDLLGGKTARLSGGPVYRFPVRPQQIVTMRFRTRSSVEEIRPLLKWDELVPEPKRAALNAYSSEKGHPPRGD